MMRFSLLAVVAALIATVLSQSISELPSCAQNCVGNSLSSTGCGTLNIACICGSTTWLNQLSCCISTTCSPQDQNTTITFADQLCAANGIQVPTAVSCASSASSTPASSATGVSNSTATTSKSTTSTTSGSASVQSSSSSTHSSSSTSSSATSNAGPHQEYGVGLGMAAAGLIAAII